MCLGVCEGWSPPEHRARRGTPVLRVRGQTCTWGLPMTGKRPHCRAGEGLTGFVACAAGACEVVRNGWTGLGQHGVARYREPGRWLQRGSRKKTRWEGRLQASDSKRATRSEGLRRPHRPGREAPDQPAARPSALRPETRPSPPRRVLRVPLSHLDSLPWPSPNPTLDTLCIIL